MAQRLDRLNRSAEIAEESNKRPVLKPCGTRGSQMQAATYRTLMKSSPLMRMVLACAMTARKARHRMQNS